MNVPSRYKKGKFKAVPGVDGTVASTTGHAIMASGRLATNDKQCGLVRKEMHAWFVKSCCVFVYGFEKIADE